MNGFRVRVFAGKKARIFRFTKMEGTLQHSKKQPIQRIEDIETVLMRVFDSDSMDEVMQHTSTLQPRQIIHPPVEVDGKQIPAPAPDPAAAPAATFAPADPAEPFQEKE